MTKSRPDTAFLFDVDNTLLDNESVQITLAEDFGVKGRGGFYEETGAIRDVMQNHLFQVLTNLAMEPTTGADSKSIRDEKVAVLKSIPPLVAKDLVRGQFVGYRNAAGQPEAGENVLGH